MARTKTERMAANRLRNEVQQMVNRGEIDDPVFLNALAKAKAGSEIEDIAGDYYELIIPKQKSARESGKVFMQPVEREHGHSDSLATYQAMIAAEALARSGRAAQPAGRNPQDIERIANILEQGVMQSSIGGIGKLGARETPTDREVLLRAAALVSDVDRGRDPVTGMPFNTMKQQGVTPLDAGHFVAHVSNPGLSNSPYNIGFQNAYENKGQAAAEKIAGNLATPREPTGEEKADMLFKSIINRTVKDVKLPRKGKARDEYMAPIHAKLRAAGIIP